MQINDIIILLRFELADYFVGALFDRVNSGNVRVAIHYSAKLNFGQVVDFHPAVHLHFEIAHHRSGKNDVADGTKPNNKDLCQEKNGIFSNVTDFRHLQPNEFTMQFFDTHAHMYAEAFAEDRIACMERAFAEGVKMVALPNIDSGSMVPMQDLCTRFPENTIGMMGLHPGSVKENFEEELGIIKKELDKGGFHAVGEIGLDLYWDKTFFHQQVEAFVTQINWAKEKKLPIAIHVREAFTELFKIMDEHCDERLSGVFHCFTGNGDDMKKALAYPNFYLGIGGVVTFKNGGLDKILPDADITRLVLETDAPYLAPVPFRGKRNETGYIKLIAEKLAEIKGMTVAEIADQTTTNARKLFKLDE